MTYRVAFAISGAVSLGSYEAGTIYEIIRAFAEHNNSQPAGSGQRIEIDVLTGASAGGMTAALIAHKLLYDPDLLEGETSNAGYQAWVEKVDIDGLLTPHKGDLPRTSLLSSNFVGKIAEDLIVNRHTNNQINTSGPHNSAADTIHLGLAMSNLNGVDYKVKVFSTSKEGLDQGDFIQTRFQDRVSETLTSTYIEKQWQEIILACRGCGAFPLAFSPIKLIRNWQRHADDYANRGASPFDEANPNADTDFYYMDGGAFNNYPLGMARALSDRVDKTPQDYENRYYFYISPNPKTSVRSSTFKVDESTSMTETAMQMVQSIFWQGRFQEWMQIDSVNERVKRLDERAENLLDMLQTSPDQVQPLSKAFDDFLDVLYKGQQAQLAADLARLEQAYCNTPTLQQLPPLLKNTWIKGVVLLEKSGDLNNRESMKVYTITATDEELASEPLAAFLGFLDKRLREHDYLLGRIRGMQVVEHILEQRANPNAKGDHLPLNAASRASQISEEKIKLLAMDLSNIRMEKVDKENREAFYRRIRARLSEWLDNEGVGGMWNKGLVLASKKYLKPLLAIENKKLFGIRMPWWYR